MAEESRRREPVTGALPPPEDESGPAGGRDEQLKLPGIETQAIIAEQVFETLARQWQAEYECQESPRKLTNNMGDLALTCVLLSVEWGRLFSPAAFDQMTRNKEIAAAHSQVSWMNELPWALCLSARSPAAPAKRHSVMDLTCNLDHHNSAIRCWMLQIAWFAAPWMNPVEAVVRLLNNFAGTLVWPYESYGLAARFFDDSEERLQTFADGFKPQNFEDQYRRRLEDVKKHGLTELQAPFWQTEAICRKKIEQAFLKRMV